MTRLLPHGVSHYVGLDCHDVGDRGLLEPGMIVTMEPAPICRIWALASASRTTP